MNLFKKIKILNCLISRKFKKSPLRPGLSEQWCTEIQILSLEWTITENGNSNCNRENGHYLCFEFDFDLRWHYGSKMGHFKWAILNGPFLTVKMIHWMWICESRKWHFILLIWITGDWYFGAFLKKLSSKWLERYIKWPHNDLEMGFRLVQILKSDKHGPESDLSRLGSFPRGSVSVVLTSRIERTESEMPNFGQLCQIRKRTKKTIAALKVILFWEDIQERFNRLVVSTNQKRSNAWPIRDAKMNLVRILRCPSFYSGYRKNVFLTMNLFIFNHNSDWLI